MIDIEYIKTKFKNYTQDKNIIEELTQITYLKLNNYSEKKYNENQYKKLIYLIVKSVYIDFYRHNKSLRSKNITISFNQLNEFDFNELYNYFNKSKDINIEVLISALDKLSEIQRDVIFLRFYYSLKYKDIAKLLGCSKNTTLSHFHNAKLKLRKYLSKNDVYDK